MNLADWLERNGDGLADAIADEPAIGATPAGRARSEDRVRAVEARPSVCLPGQRVN
jgi:hypothetical protein